MELQNDMIDRVLLCPYYLTLKLRDRYYRRRESRLYTPDVPSVCVGNITVGGTGKTPHVEMILRMLHESPEWRDRNLAVLSRGYKRESKGFQQVVPEGSATMFGDEPLQIKKKFLYVTVAVDRNRIEACEVLTSPGKLSEKKFAKCWNKVLPKADYIVLDDAFQYRRLKPSLNVVLVDSNRPISTDRLLPLGRLRDLKERIADADVVIVTKCSRDIEDEEKCAFASSLGVGGYNVETCCGVSATGRSQMLLFTYISYCRPVGVYPETDARYIYAKKAVLVSGIAADTPLRRYVSDFAKIVKRFSFPDHHKYEWKDINKLCAALRKHSTAAIITTEKDVQRLMDYNGMPAEIKERLLAVPIEARFVSEHEEALFRQRICSLTR